MIRRNSRRRRAYWFIDFIFFSAIASNFGQMAADYEYWKEAPYPFYIFLNAQLILLILMIRIPMGSFSNRCVERSMMPLFLALMFNTVVGTIWMVKFNNEEDDFLKTRYYVEGIILLSIPLTIAGLILFLFFVYIVIFIRESRNGRIHRFEEEPQENNEEIVETYMKMLDDLGYQKDQAKYNDCAICLKEFEEKEKLKMIPSCQHIFHEHCLKNWFLQLQICPMCRGNIIKMPQRNQQIEDNENRAVQDGVNDMHVL